MCGGAPLGDGHEDTAVVTPRVEVRTGQRLEKGKCEEHSLKPQSVRLLVNLYSYHNRLVQLSGHIITKNILLVKTLK